jgi:hypothetical protein
VNLPFGDMPTLLPRSPDLFGFTDATSNEAFATSLAGC